MTKNGNRDDTTRVIERLVQTQQATREALELRRAAIHAVRACDVVLGWQTKIVRVDKTTIHHVE